MTQVIEVDVRTDENPEVTTAYRFAHYTASGAGVVHHNPRWGTLTISGVQNHVTRIRKADVPALIKALQATQTMSGQNDGGAAFPEAHPGMSLRDYFAAKAMQGIMAADGADTTPCEQVASIAYLIANHMLDKRGEKQ